MSLSFAQMPGESMQYIFPDEESLIPLIGWKMNVGDSSHWRDVVYDDSHWEENTGNGLWINEGTDRKGIRWYRKVVFFPQPLDSLDILSLYQIAVVSANEIYWDGVLIARNGQPGGSLEEENTGRSGQIFPISQSLTHPGKHVVAMRVSNFHCLSGVIEVPIQIGYSSKIHARLFRMQAISLFLAGVLFLTALFHFVILLGRGNKWPYGLFSMYCLSCSVYMVIRGLLRYFQVDLVNYYTLAALNDIPWFFMIVLLPVFFLFEFSSPYKKRLTTYIVAVGAIVVILPRLMLYGMFPLFLLSAFDKANQVHLYFTIFVSIWVTFWALYHRMRGSLSASCGLLIFLLGIIITNSTYIENGWAIGFTVLTIFLNISLSNQMAYQNRLHGESMLRSARLEVELLKKHIHPHFLLNSLNSIVAWLEEDPPTASILVNAFADELRMLLNFSGKNLILLTEEIDLCKAHLRVMSLRHEKEYTLSVDGINGDEKIPPLVIHTLVENGLTHGYIGKDKGTFSLKCEHEIDSVVVTLFNDSAGEKETTVLKDGTGMRYVKMRLEESFPSSWKLKTGSVDGGWEVIITMKGRAV